MILIIRILDLKIEKKIILFFKFLYVSKDLYIVNHSLIILV
jgi:hypothetical protein